MLTVPVYQAVTGKRITNIPQWLIDIEGTELIKRGIIFDDTYKTESYAVNDYTHHFIVYNRNTYKDNAQNNNASIIGRYDYTFNPEGIGTEYITLY